MPKTHTFKAELWEWESQASWFFVSLPTELSDELEAVHGAAAAGFGSLKVEVTVGATTWATSVFPDKGRATYVLPVKKAIRKAEGLDAGKAVTYKLRVTAG